VTNKPRWPEPRPEFEVHRKIEISHVALLIAIVAMLFVVTLGNLRGQDTNTLSELEHTKLQLIQEKLKTQAANAALIRASYENNQQEGRQLVTEETLLLDQICRAHQLEPHNCQLAQDGNHVTTKTPPADPKASVPAAPAKK
jgi:hypothetical protein